ncbi:Phage capsid family protein [compost metagenome]
MTLKELQQKLAGLAVEMRSLHESVGEGAMTGEQRGKWEELRSAHNLVKEQIAREEELRSNDQTFVENNQARIKKENPEQRSQDEQRSAAYDNYIRHGLADLTGEERQILKAMNEEARANGAAQGDKGGFTVPTSFMTTIIEAQKDFGGIASVAHLLTTDNGQAIDWATSDGTEEIGELLGENQETSEGDVEFGTGTLGAHKLSSKIIRISNELLQDSGVDIEAFLARRIASRLERGKALYLVKGTGAGTPQQPAGLEVSTGVGKVTANAAGFTWQEVNGLIHSIDPVYRASSQFRLAFNDNTLQRFEEMVDGQNRPLWLPGIDADRPATILKQKYVIDQAIDSIGAGKKFMFAGDFAQFIVRQVRYMAIKRLMEKFAEFDQTGFLAFTRFGCVLQDLAAIKALQGKPA